MPDPVVRGNEERTTLPAPFSHPDITEALVAPRHSVVWSLPAVEVAVVCQCELVSLQPTMTSHGRTMTSVFSLLGAGENDLTAALGWTLRHSPELLAQLTTSLDPAPTSPTVAIDLEVRDEHGRTDLELHGQNHIVVVEAKRGWLLPGHRQLAAYANRMSSVPVRHLVTLSDCSPEWARLHLPEELAGVKVTHVPWAVIRGHIAAARRTAGWHERLWLDQLETYLKESLRVVEVNNAEAYCVVISHDRPGGGGPHTFREVVEEGFYYYPYGRGGWPSVPPNFFAFRWDNQVQRVHRVMTYEVVPSLQTQWPDIPIADETDRPHVICRLGPALRMEPLPSGHNYRATRLWVLLDQLFTAETLKEALRESQRLRGEIPADPPTT